MPFALPALFCWNALMPRLFTSVSAIILCLSTAVAQQSKGSPEARLKQFLAMVNKPVVLSKPGMESVAIKKDIAYKTTEQGPLKMDVYTPAGQTPAPVVVLIHGG